MDVPVREERHPDDQQERQRQQEQLALIRRQAELEPQEERAEVREGGEDKVDEHDHGAPVEDETLEQVEHQQSRSSRRQASSSSLSGFEPFSIPSWTPARSGYGASVS